VVDDGDAARSAAMTARPPVDDRTCSPSIGEVGKLCHPRIRAVKIVVQPSTGG
jgi:hypothetical protein